jgi:hypothetical protein
MIIRRLICRVFGHSWHWQFIKIDTLDIDRYCSRCGANIKLIRKLPINEPCDVAPGESVELSFSVQRELREL